MRPSNKELDWFDPYDDFFDQCIDSDLFQLSENTFEPSSSDDALNFFDLSGSSNEGDHTDTSPMPNLDLENTDSDGSWQGALRYLEGDAASPVLRGNRASVRSESSSKAAASDSGLFSLGDICGSQIPTAAPALSTPGSPSPLSHRNKEGLSSTLTNVCFRPKPSGVRKPSRKGSASPKMMDSSHYRTGYQGAWAKRMEAAANRYNLQFSANGKPVSPPPSSDLSQGDFEHSTGNGFDPLHNMATLGDELVSPMTNTFSYEPMLNQTPVHSPTLFDSNNRTISCQQPSPLLGGFLQTQRVEEALNALQTPPRTQQLPTGAWAHGATPNPLDSSFSASPEFENAHKAEAWWTPTSVSQPTSPTYQDAQRNLMALGLDSAASTDLATGGLMISCEPPDIDSLLGPTQTLAVAASPRLCGHSRSYTTSAIPSAYPLNQHASFSRSPSSSPPPITPTHTRRASSKPRSSHHRRKSSSGGNNNNNNSARPASVGFVNFTPDDSRKILTGVAPSGSSKTKARREKEAAEKRRKLSEAAKRAIIEAGGDLNALEKEGLFLLVSDL